jgi:hypothetical protein
MAMTFTTASPGAGLPPAPPQQPSLPRLGRAWKAYTGPGVYEVVKAVTADGQWLFVRAADGTWSTGHLPSETVVRAGRRSLGSCRAYVGSGQALEDLEQIRAAGQVVPGD